MAFSKQEILRRHYAKKRAFLSAYKSERGCNKCELSDARVLDFHHKNPSEKHKTLKRTTSKSGFHSLSWADLREELEKCDILCANCHRIEEWERRYGGK